MSALPSRRATTRRLLDAQLPFIRQQRYRDALQGIIDGVWERVKNGVVEAVAKECGIEVEVVKRSDQAKGFVVQARRWVVERTFGWLNRERRL